MSTASKLVNGHRRASSSSTVRAAGSVKNAAASAEAANMSLSTKATLWVHDDNFSHDEILINPAVLTGTRITEGSLVEIIAYEESIEVVDFEAAASDSDDPHKPEIEQDADSKAAKETCLCIVKFAPSDMLTKHSGLELSMTRIIADAFKMHSRSQVILKSTNFQQRTASHVELCFRDAYLARSDMWRLVSQELANRVVFKGQKISFLGTMKLTVKDIHVGGHKVSNGVFAATTVPVFRSEAARYVLFIQMSREMWDFDSEGSGEIMFNRVINGFLPDLFRRWVQLEVRHLVSIVMFGRLEYDRHDLDDSSSTTTTDKFSQSSSITTIGPAFHQDFFRVVVTDMASAQWTTILNELKKDFRVFLRDICLHEPITVPFSRITRTVNAKITGRPSTALKGNILEAINLASSQFANDYIDRDLIRTGVSTVIVTAGAGVFDVDRDLLNLTSQNLTNNGIGIDIVCLSRMPLHSVPLFRYRLPQSTMLSRVESNVSSDLRGLGTSLPSQPVGINQSSALSSYTSTSANYFSRFPSAFPSKSPQPYGYGIPHWVDLSYWSSASERSVHRPRRKEHGSQKYRQVGGRKPFVPRVRMYELQMMGLMELGMADIFIPYIVETPLRPRRPRHQSSVEFSVGQMARSLSQSPSYFRKSSALATRRNNDIGTLAHQSHDVGTSLAIMEEYDDLIFLDVNQPRKSSVQKQNRHIEDLNRHRTKSKRELSRGQKPAEVSEVDITKPTKSSLRPLKEDMSTDSTPPRPLPKSKTAKPRISRSISYALRGLPAPLRATTHAESSLESVKALPLLATTSLTQASAASPSVMRSESIRSLEGRDVDARSIMSSDSTNEQVTKPISIKTSTYRPVSQQVNHKLQMPIRSKIATGTDRERANTTWTHSPSQSSEDELETAVDIPKIISDSIPQSALPFIRNVNASNPLKRQPQAGSVFGRWQHLYPHKPRAAIVKWRSLCTPASVPLTTEDFPSAIELADEYDSRSYQVQVRHASDAQDASIALDPLLLEMVVLRLSHGYQVIIGNAVRTVVGNTLCESSVFMDPARLSKYGDAVLMSMGNTIQKLSFGGQDAIHVTKYVKKDTEVEHPFPPLYSYSPNIRTILATDYWPRSMELRGFSEEYPWELADNYLAEGQPDSSTKVQKLRFWRARFILLPVEPPSNAWRPQQSGDDNEEEIHLLGIRALTQMWQKARYYPPSERKVGPGRLANSKKRDQNPFEIKFDTLNPSELVATELDKLLALEEAGEVSSTQLLPEPEKLDRDTPMVKLAQAMQGEKGIEIKTRRWHWRLHYNCFHGEEFTNWLLLNVKNVENRDEAVEFGKSLMKEGLFEHVNGRHHFRDGNYFYSLKQEFKTPRLDLKGSWFAGARRPEKSVPPTPISEHPTRDSLQTATRSRSGSSLAHSLNPANSLDQARTLLEKKKKTVTLTKMIKIDVDPRKRSNRPEIVNLHYDRFHNPENCYHLELSWLNTTSKLVDDAIVSWTNQAERFGLKLVEVPIAEASTIPNSEPFRRAYPIKLALEPPKRHSIGHVLTSSSFTPQAYSNPERNVYQKAILKRFNFVLDLEGASEFPDTVDVQHSSAGLEYKYTQFVHRSGVCLAQITDEGDFLLLANRLYNARAVNTRDSSHSRLDLKREPMLGPGLSHRPAVPPQFNNNIIPPMQASGIIGLNLQSPRISATPSPSPLPRATADVLGSRSAISASTLAQYITPEQIKDEVQQFCSDVSKLDAFYKEFNSTPPSASAQASANTLQTRRSTSTSSSALKPIQDANEGIEEFNLPESVTSPGTTTSSSSGFGFGFGGLMSRRARPSVGYENVAEIFGRSGTVERGDSPRDRNSPSQPGSAGGRTGSNSGEASGKTSGDVSGNMELKIRIDTPSGRRTEEGGKDGGSGSSAGNTSTMRARSKS